MTRVLVVCLGVEIKARVFELRHGSLEQIKEDTERLRKEEAQEKGYNACFGTDFHRLAMLCFRLSVHKSPACVAVVIDAKLDENEMIEESSILRPWWFKREIAERLSRSLGEIRVMLCTPGELKNFQAFCAAEEEVDAR